MLPRSLALLLWLSLWPGLVSHAGGQAVSDELHRGLSWQMALDREGFSPGLIDGKPGRKTALATEAFQRFAGLPVTGKLDDATAAALKPDAAILATYTVTEDDARRVTGVPADWVERSKLAYAGYESLADLVAEKFHCTQGLLARLNASRLDLARLKIGDRLTVPNLGKAVELKAAGLRIDLTEKVLRALDDKGRVVALFHCSIAADPAKRPRGSTTITAVAENPEYLFDPRNWPEVRGVERRLIIKPGPRNPVGACWIALALPGYGIHGAPKPEHIGKTGSHGCFRLANWDALRLARMVAPGMSVTFVD